MIQLATWTPKTWEAAHTTKESINYKCCKCESELLAGAAYRGLEFNFNTILVTKVDGGPFVTPLLYCQKHLPKTVYDL